MATIEQAGLEQTFLPSGSRGKSNLTLTSMVLASLLVITLLSVQLDRELAGVVALVLLMVMLLGQLHIGVAMGVSGLAAIYNQQGLSGVGSVLRSTPFDTAASWSLTVIPMFVLMGMLLWQSGVADKAYGAAAAWLGNVPGGLAVTTNVAGAGLSAASGSTMGMAYAMGKMGIPSMMRAKYPPALALAAVLTVGMSAQLIPPSLLSVVYAGVAGTVVGDQLLAGIVPGVVLIVINSLLFIGAAWFVERRRGKRMGRRATSWAEKRQALLGVIPLGMIVVVVLGGLYFGVFTATEAGAVGAALALVALVVQHRGQSWPSVRAAGLETITTVGAIFLLIMGAAILSRAMLVTGVTRLVGDAIVGSDFSRVQFLLIVMLVYLVLGMFLEPMSIILLMVPILLPVLGTLDISLIWFGVFTVLMAELGMVTPPVGILLYIVHKLAQERDVNLGTDITIRDAILAAIAFTGVGLVLAVVIIVFPGLVELLVSPSGVG